LLALACRLRGIPLVTSVQDTYPESLTVQGRLGDRSAWLYRFLRWLDRKTKQSCAAVIVISERFKQIYVQDRGIPPDRVHLIPNWIDESVVQVNPADNCIRRSHEIPDDAFLVVYAGNVGTAAGVETVIKAFQDLTSEQNIYVLVAGSGSKLFDCRELAGKVDNPRVLFHTPWLDSETSSMLAAASLFILPTIGDQSLASVPSKLISYMLAGSPVLCCATPESDIAKTIADASCGWAIPPDDYHAIAKEILLLSKLPTSELEKFGERGRIYALQHMTRKANLPVLVKLVKSMH
jgi:glycosyltransferase involved in cell wall biosynthesis